MNREGFMFSAWERSPMTPVALAGAILLHAGLVLMPLIPTEKILEPSGDKTPMHVSLVKRAPASAIATPKPVQKTPSAAVKPVAVPTPRLTQKPSPIIETPQVSSETLSTDAATSSQGTESTETGTISQSTAKGNDRPDIIKRVDPHYPKVAIQRGMQGTAVFRVKVLASGDCGDIELVQSSGYAMLDNAAKQSLKQWQFSPTQHTAMATGFWVEIPIAFVLRDRA